MKLVSWWSLEKLLLKTVFASLKSQHVEENKTMQRFVRFKVSAFLSLPSDATVRVAHGRMGTRKRRCRRGRLSREPVLNALRV